MKVLIGWLETAHGTVEATSRGLIYGGSDPEHVREIVERKRHWCARTGIPHTLSDDELVKSLPYRLQGSRWAVFVDERTGLAQDRSEYDPWGDLWRSRTVTAPAPPPEIVPRVRYLQRLQELQRQRLPADE